MSANPEENDNTNKHDTLCWQRQGLIGGHPIGGLLEIHSPQEDYFLLFSNLDIVAPFSTLQAAIGYAYAEFID